MPSIGSLVLKLVANQEALMRGLDQAEGRVNASAGKMTRAWNSVSAKGLADATKAATTKAAGYLAHLEANANKVGKTFSRLAGTIISLPLPDAKFGLISSAFSFFTDAEGKFAQIAKVGKMSDMLGLDTETISTLEAMGVSTDSLSSKMRAFQRTLNGAKLEGEDLDSKLDQFGLSTEKLKGMSIERAFQETLNFARDMKSPLQRAGLEMAAFGRSGTDLDLVIRRTDADMKSALESSRKFGNSFSRIDAFKIEAGLRSIKQIERVFEGMKTQLAIGIAPYITVVANSLESWVKSGEGAGEMFRKVGDYIGQGVVFAIDAVASAIEKLGEVMDKAGRIMNLGGNNLLEKAEEARRAQIKRDSDHYRGTKYVVNRDTMGTMEEDVARGKRELAHMEDMAMKGDANAVEVVRNLRKQFAELDKGFPTASEQIKTFADKFRDKLAALDRDAQKFGDDAKKAAAQAAFMIDPKAVYESSQALDKLIRKFETSLDALNHNPGSAHAAEIAEAQKTADAVMAIRVRSEEAIRAALRKIPVKDVIDPNLFNPAQGVEAVRRWEAAIAGSLESPEVKDALHRWEESVKKAQREVWTAEANSRPRAEIDALQKRATDQAEQFKFILERIAEAQKATDGTDKKLAYIQALDKQIQSTERYWKAVEQGFDLMVDVETPLEKFDKDLARISNLLQAGVIDWETYERATKKAAGAASDAMAKQGEFSSPKALVKGSQEAFALIVKNEMRGKSDPNKAITDRLDRQNQLMERLLIEADSMPMILDLLRQQAIDNIR